MPRQPKPYFRKSQKRWVCTINGNRITLGKNKEEAMAKYHQLMLKPQTVSSELSTIYDLSQVYLDWVEKHRKKSTYDNHKRYLKTFIESIGKSMKISALRKHHVLSWSENKGTSTIRTATGKFQLAFLTSTLVITVAIEVNLKLRQQICGGSRENLISDLTVNAGFRKVANATSPIH